MKRRRGSLKLLLQCSVNNNLYNHKIYDSHILTQLYFVERWLQQLRHHRQLFPALHNASLTRLEYLLRCLAFLASMVCYQPLCTRSIRKFSYFFILNKYYFYCVQSPVFLSTYLCFLHAVDKYFSFEKFSALISETEVSW